MTEPRSSEAIRSETMRRGIRRLLHFTQVWNVPGIVSSGLLSRAALAESGLDAFASKEYRLDRRDEAVSVSVSSVNAGMFGSKRQASGHPHWVVLLLDPGILWTHRCRFCFRNAARREVAGHRGHLGGPWGFARMFADDGPPSFDGRSYRAETGIPDDLPTFPDAEIQVFDPIPPETVRGAWLDRADYAASVQSELDRLPGGERDVVIAPFASRLNGHEGRLMPDQGWTEGRETPLPATFP